MLWTSKLRADCYESLGLEIDYLVSSSYLLCSGPQRILGHTDMYQSPGDKVPCEHMRTSPYKRLHRTQVDNLERDAEKGELINDSKMSLNIAMKLIIEKN